MDEGLQKLVRFINENPSLAPNKTFKPAQLSDFFSKHPEYKGVVNKRAILNSGEKFGLEWTSNSNGRDIIKVKTIVRKEVQTTIRAPNAFYHLDTLRTYIVDTEGQSSTPIKWCTDFLGQFFSRHPECKGHINKAAVENAPHHLKLSWITVAPKNYIFVGINTPTTTEIPPVTHQVTIPGGRCFQFVDDVSKATELINQLRNVSVIGLDIEGDLSREGQLSIIQVSIDTQADGVRVFIFDILKCPQIIDVGGLQDILSQKGITKVLHDCRQDCQALFFQHNVRLCNVFDTQVAYAELNMEHGQQRGLNTVLDQYAEGANNKLKGEIIHRRGLWDSRPLVPKLLSYAAQDVESIVAAHRKMKRDLEEQGKLQIVMERVDNIIDGICSVHVQSNVDASDCIPMGLLRDYPMGTTKFIQFDEIGECNLSDEPFFKGEDDAKGKTVPPNRDLKDLYELADILPKDIRKAFYDFPVRDFTTEIVLDMGRRPLVRYVLSGGDGDEIQTCSGELGCREICRDDLDQICKSEKLGSYTLDNRAGFSSTLHRISRKLNRSGHTIALTLRVGRMVQGSTKMITDIVSSSRSVLLLGIPGVGKTTLLREYSRVLACSNKRVEIVDTSNEIAGDGDVPHHSVGQARRMMVNDRREQHRVMIEAVQNHMPQCIVVDEIGTKAEANAAGDIAQRGVQIVATAHGKRVCDLLQSAELCGLVGGVHTVILGDDEAQRRGLRSKSVRERKGPPVFDTIVELRSHHHWVVYNDVASAVDDILGERTSPVFEVRSLDPATGEITVTKTNIFE